MRLRRKDSKSDDTGAAPQEQGSSEAGAPPASTGAAHRPHGPWDVTERPVDEDDPGRAHLGALSVAGRPGVELRLQVDEASGDVAAVILMAQDGAMELRVFAAPRNESIWDDVRRKIGAEATRRGGTASEVEGPFGPALHLMVTGAGPDGQPVTQPSTVHGVSGPRWLLRVSTFGRPAAAWDPQGTLEQALSDVVVIRGNSPMPPGEALPMKLPARAQRLDQS